MKIEWHPAAVGDLESLGAADQKRIRKALSELEGLRDPKQRLAPYSAALKGFWKFRVGDFRLICQLVDRGGIVVLIVHLAHRSQAYSQRSLRVVDKRRI